MVVAVFDMVAVLMRNHTVGFQERLGWFLQLGLYVLLYGALVGGLY